MLSIEMLKSRGVCLWAYARSQATLEGMIHEAETLIDQLELINGKASDRCESSACASLPMGLGSEVATEPPVSAHHSRYWRLSRDCLGLSDVDQSGRQHIQTLSDGVALRLESLRLLLRHMDEFSMARLKLGSRRRVRAAQPPQVPR